MNEKCTSCLYVQWLVILMITGAVNTDLPRYSLFGLTEITFLLIFKGSPNDSRV